jgi:hypothetical protein
VAVNRRSLKGSQSHEEQERMKDLASLKDLSYEEQKRLKDLASLKNFPSYEEQKRMMEELRKKERHESWAKGIMWIGGLFLVLALGGDCGSPADRYMR